MKFLILVFIAIMLVSCTNITRIEQDVYTITHIDTNNVKQQRNPPGEREQGIIYPSNEYTKNERELVQRDSIVERFYPAFIRVALFESTGLLLGGKRDNAAGLGMFGIFPDFEHLSSGYRGSSDNSIVGGIYRLGIFEKRLRWFRDAENWTYGTSFLTAIIPDSRFEYAFLSIFPLQIRKRYYLKKDIPYVCFTPGLELGYFPSQFINAFGSLDVGSIGGLNMRLTAGLAFGNNQSTSYSVKQTNNIDKKSSYSMVFPYLGIGISMLDFLNKVEETEVQWKDHEHSAWDVGLFQAALLFSGAEKSLFSVNDNNPAIKGLLLHFVNASIALPFSNYKFYAGTSLFNLIGVGYNEWGVGILPIRVGYWQTVLSDELSLDPFIEYSYYPSSIFHLGSRLNLRIGEQFNIGFMLGYVSGSTSNNLGKTFYDMYEKPLSFSRVYAGISVGMFDRIFFPQELRYKVQ